MQCGCMEGWVMSVIDTVTRVCALWYVFVFVQQELDARRLEQDTKLRARESQVWSAEEQCRARLAEAEARWAAVTAAERVRWWARLGWQPAWHVCRRCQCACWLLRVGSLCDGGRVAVCRRWRQMRLKMRRADRRQRQRQSCGSRNCQSGMHGFDASHRMRRVDWRLWRGGKKHCSLASGYAVLDTVC